MSKENRLICIVVSAAVVLLSTFATVVLLTRRRPAPLDVIVPPTSARHTLPAKGTPVTQPTLANQEKPTAQKGLAKKRAILSYQLDDWKVFGEELGLGDIILDTSGYIGYLPDTRLRLEVSYYGNRIDHIMIADFIKPFKAAKARALEVWRKLDSQLAESLTQLMPEDENAYNPGLRWWGKTDYALGYAPYNKTFIEYVGPQSNYAHLIQQEEQVVRLVLNWHDYIEDWRAKIVKDPKKETFLDALGSLRMVFGFVNSREDLTPLQSKKEYRVPFQNQFDDVLWPHWPEGTRMHLMRAAGRCHHIADLAVRLIRKDKLSFRPFDEMMIALSYESNRAISAVYGRYGNLIGHKDRVTGLPKDLQDKFNLISIKSLAAVMSDTKEEKEHK